jgi:hypothetical protein
MQTSVYQLFVGVLMWSVIMLMPSLISYFQDTNPLVATALLTTLYPISLSFLSRRPNFWVSPTVIMLAAVCSLFVSAAMDYLFVSKNVNVDRFVPIVVFVVALTILSTQIDMYGTNVYGSSNNSNSKNYLRRYLD